MAGPAAAVGFVVLLVATLGAMEGLSRRRAGSCAAFAAVFCASYLSPV